MTHSTERDHAGVIAPPPLIFLGAMVLGWLINRVISFSIIPDALQLPIGIVILVSSMMIGLAAALHFIRAGTALEPHQSTTAIVSSGVYRYTRNPIYLSMALFQLGVGIAFDNVWIMLMLIPALIIITRGVIEREERYLEHKFGEEYLRYKRSVRRWL